MSISVHEVAKGNYKQRKWYFVIKKKKNHFLITLYQFNCSVVYI